MENSTIWQKGQKVLTRCVNGTLRSNVVWEAVAGRVFVCSDRQFEALMRGQDAPPPIGFRERDVVPQ